MTSSDAETDFKPIIIIIGHVNERNIGVEKGLITKRIRETSEVNHILDYGGHIHYDRHNKLRSLVLK